MSSSSNLFTRKWWKEAVVYQIYPRSFQDSNGDGIGDLKGITKRLDYLKELGVDVIWLSPVYESPNDDNGYDISDYHRIMKDFGTLEDWEEMITEMHKRGIRLLMDLVANHTSDEHEWFKKSRESKDNPYRDYYIWKPAKEGNEPTNWISFFSGSVWQYDEPTDEYYLHLFSKKQPDLNWENPTVRNEIMEMVRWWLDKGVDGFRMDVINVISKVQSFPDSEVTGTNDQSQGAQFYFNGPRLIEFLSELKENVFSKYDCFTVGEMPCVTPEHGSVYTDINNGVVNMLFHFEHMGMDIEPGKSKWYTKKWELTELKKIMTLWQIELRNGWNALYLENHDQPRSVSRFLNDNEHRTICAKLLVTWLHMLQGTPYVYQGQELGMTNIKLESIEDYNDLETLNMYREEISKGTRTKEELMDEIWRKSRDNARTPMQWDDSPNAGFTAPNVKPWLKVNPNHTEINVEKQMKDPNSVWNYYKKIIHLRKQHLVIVYGIYDLVCEDHPQVYAYTRTLGNEQLLVVCNFTEQQARITVDENIPILDYHHIQLLICNYDDVTIRDNEKINNVALRPYEARVYKLIEFPV